MWPFQSSKWFSSKYGDEILEGRMNPDGSLTLTWKIDSGTEWELVSTRVPPENLGQLRDWLNQVVPRYGKIIPGKFRSP